ncbi:MAG: hypothetical protein Q9191_000017 [Dirinaria sp. TL-2023a]
MAFPAPVAPDIEECNPQFNQPTKPTFDDCKIAFSLIPEDAHPIIWKNGPAEGDPHTLPFSVKHGKVSRSGTCEIVFQTSGPAAAEIEYIEFPGYGIRRMAGRVIERCIEREGEFQGGGFLTQNFGRLLDDVSIAGNGFFEHFHLAERMKFNPGNQDFVLVAEIEEKVLKAEEEYAPGSGSHQELEMRVDAISYALNELDDSFDANTPNWWDFYPAPEDACETGIAKTDVARRAMSSVIVMPIVNCTNATKATSKKMRRRLRLADEHHDG